MSAFMKLSTNDFVKGLVVAILAAVFTVLAQWLNAPGFDFATFQWGELARITIVAAMAYLGKNFVSTSDGKVLGKIG